jgi:hypothetical protein
VEQCRCDRVAHRSESLVDKGNIGAALGNRTPDLRIASRKREVHQRSRAAWRCSPTCAPVGERPVPTLLGWLLRLIEQLQGPFTALPMIFHNWAGEAKAEFKTALAPAAIIVLMPITFLCNGVAVFLRNRFDKRW